MNLGKLNEHITVEGHFEFILEEIDRPLYCTRCKKPRTRNNLGFAVMQAPSTPLEVHGFCSKCWNEFIDTFTEFLKS
jgi:hypothetical protein